MPRGYPQGTIFDGVTSFSGGVNSGLSSLLLEPNQLAFATNCTVRGGFVSHRPTYQKLTLDFRGDEDLQAAVEEGLFQGAMVYRPDFGNHLILSSISGRIYSLSISGEVATVSDITPEGDPNPPTIQQVWMWQSENYAIINDGTNLPIIFDGSSSRRSFGGQVVLATTSANFTPPAIGETVTLTLSEIYTGPYDVPVIINSGFYQPIRTSTTSTYDISVTSISNEPLTVSEGDEIISDPSRVAKVISFNGSSTGTISGQTSVAVYFNRKTADFLTPLINGPFRASDNSYPIKKLTVGDFQFDRIRAFFTPSTLSPSAEFFADLGVSSEPSSPNYSSLVNKTAVSPSADPTVIVGSAQSPFSISARGVNLTNSSPDIPWATSAEDSTEDTEIDTLFSGSDGTVAWVGDIQVSLSTPTPDSPTTSLTVINLTDETTDPVVFPEDILSVPELPAGRMGAYGMGRNWMSLTDGLSFIAGDIVGGDSGSQANSYRDSVLKVTENTFLAEGGVFRLPSSGDFIRAMIFTANMDTSLGQGPLQVFTSRTVFSVNAPVDRTTWQDLENPILTQSLIGSGALAQDATFQVNSDTFFRALDGWRTLILARREFDQQWGNTPITREMERTFVQEDKSLIPFTSGVQFDNRALFSAVPQSTARGIAASAIVALNLDPVSSIRGKLPPVYDGVWTGLNVFKLMRAVIDSTDRSFAFHYNSETQKIELWELLKTREDNRFDNGTDRIEWSFEMASLFVDVPDRPLLRLLDGELQFDNIVGELDVVVQYKPDQYPCWTEWTRFTICAKESSDEEFDNKPGFQPRVGLGEPDSSACDEYTGRPFREGHTFQFRIALKGSGRFIGARFAAVPVPDPMFAPPICNGV